VVLFVSRPPAGFGAAEISEPARIDGD
jgi:hypothetical protein